MNIIKNQYKAISGYNDVAPGVTSIEICVDKTEPDDEGNSITIFKPEGDMTPHFNEIQVSGDKALRLEYLPEGDDGSSILFLDDPDYDAKKLRRQLICTSTLPLTEDDNFVRRWAALSMATEDIIANGTLSNLMYVDGGDWGDIETNANKKSMLAHISNMDQSTKDSLTAVANDAQWAADFIIWRDTLPEGDRIQYQSV